MKKFLSLFLALVLVLGAVAVLGSCGKQTEEEKKYEIPDVMTSDNGKYQIAMVTDIGQLKDGSFNEGTWNGVKEVASFFGMSYKYYQPANGADAGDQDRVDAFNLAIQNGAEIIVCPGFAFGTALSEVVPANPTVKFVFIDGWTIGQPNLTAVAFQEEQCGYLAGYAAVKEGYTKLGGTFGGGSTNDACNRYAWGYIQGANAAAAEMNKTVEVKVSFKFGSSFQASSDLQAQIAGWYETGTEVVFACGGSMCQSVFAAAAENNKKTIGVDVDQSGDSKTVITSAMKGLAQSVKRVVAEYILGNFDAKLSDELQVLGAAQDAVGLPTATWSMTNFTVEQYNTMFNGIKAGTIKIDDTKVWSDIKTAAQGLANITFSVDE